MKKVFLVMYLFWGASVTVQGAVTLRFEFAGGTPENVQVNAPLVAYDLDPVYLDTAKECELTFDLDGVYPIGIFIDNMRAFFYVEPGKTYNITVDSTPGRKGITVDEPVAARYLELTKDWDSYKYDSGSDYSVYPLSTSGAEMMSNFEDLIRRDRAVFDGMEMSPAMRDVLMNDIEVYHLASLAMALRQDWWRHGFDDTKMYPDFIETWKKVYEKYPIAPKYIKSIYLTDYAEQNGFWLQLYLSGNPRNSDFNIRIDPYYDIIEDSEVREEVLMRVIYIEAILNNPDRNDVVVPAIRKFLDTFPENRYADVMENFLVSIREWKTDPAERFSPDMKLVDGYGEITSMAEALDRFRGKPVFVDFWFIACPHCVYEFGKSAELKKFLKDNGIEILYLAREDAEADTQWRNAIIEYGLTGNHIRMSPELLEDVRANGYALRGYPSYMIVDREGRVVVPDAKRPSSGEELKSQIREALDI